MKMQRVNISRREFLIHTGLTGASFVLGLSLPLGNRALAAETAASETIPEVNAWVVIEPDDTVIIRVARSEMGQGTLTGLAQLVAEELECDWSKVKTEYPTPGQNLARDRIWGSFATGGSRGIRGSHQYVREGGALAREMLRAAAAEAWDVAVGECTVAASLIFYGFWRVEFIPVMLVSTIVDYLAALGIHGSANAARRRAYLAASLTVNLGLLFYFKYLIFAAENVTGLLQLLGFDAHPAGR